METNAFLTIEMKNKLITAESINKTLVKELESSLKANKKLKHENNDIISLNQELRKDYIEKENNKENYNE